jgi:hypothetical protein
MSERVKCRHRRGSSSIGIGADHLIARSGAEGTPSAGVDRVLEESHRPIGENSVRAARVIAAGRRVRGEKVAGPTVISRREYVEVIGKLRWYCCPRYVIRDVVGVFQSLQSGRIGLVLLNFVFGT